MVAFPPTCNRERETASQTFISDGFSTTGVTVDSATDVSVRDGAEAGGCVDVLVRPGVLVPVGEGAGGWVFVSAIVDVGGMEVGIPVEDDKTGTDVDVG